MRDVGGADVQDLLNQSLFGREVVVQASRKGARLGGDLRQGGLRIAFERENLGSRFQYPAVLQGGFSGFHVRTVLIRRRIYRQHLVFSQIFTPTNGWAV